VAPLRGRSQNAHGKFPRESDRSRAIWRRIPDYLFQALPQHIVAGRIPGDLHVFRLVIVGLRHQPRPGQCFHQTAGHHDPALRLEDLLRRRDPGLAHDDFHFLEQEIALFSRTFKIPLLRQRQRVAVLQVPTQTAPASC
jgi:hypothetical protein